MSRRSGGHGRHGKLLRVAIVGVLALSGCSSAEPDPEADPPSTSAWSTEDTTKWPLSMRRTVRFLDRQLGA